MKLLSIIKFLAVFICLVITITYNGCGKMQSNLAQTSSSASSQAEPLQFDRSSVLEFSKAGFTVKGSCPKGSLVQILIDGQIQSPSISCTTGIFSYPLQLSGVDGPKVILISLGTATPAELRDSITVYKDTTSPLLSIQNVVPTSGYIVITGICETALPLTFGGDIVTSSAAECLNGMFQASAMIRTSAGAKSLQVTQTDKAGNIGSTSFNFEPDASAPPLLVNSPAVGSFVGASSAVTGTCESGLPVSLSGSALAQPLQIPCSVGIFNQTLAIAGGDGSKTIIASQTDATGNKTEVIVNIVKDTMAPLLTIAQPASGITVQNSALSVSGSCESGLPVVLLGTGLSATTQVACTNSLYSTTVVLTSGTGQKMMDVQQSDLAGNKTLVSRGITSVAPASLLAITQPATGSLSTGMINVVGNCDTSATLTFSGDIVPVSEMICSNGSFSRALTLSINDGPKTVSIRQTLNAVISNTSRSFIKDTTAPTLTIAQPLTNSIIFGNFIISGSCESSLTVAIAGTGLSSSVNASCSNGSYSATLAVTAGDGAKSFSAQQTDGAGNRTSITRSVTRDSVLPVLTVVSPTNGSFVPATAIVAGACETGLPVLLSGLGLSANITASCSVGMYSQNITFSAGEGTKEISVKQTDLANNMSVVSLSLIKDTTAPQLTIVEPAAGTKAVAGLTIKGACESGLNVKASGTGLASEITAACIAQAYSINITFSAGDGVKAAIVSQSDGAGNTTSVNRQFEKGAAVVDTMANLTAAKSVLASYCLNCHKVGGQAAYADLNLSSDADFIAKGFVVPGKPDESKLIFRLLRYTGPTVGGARNMPVGGTTATFPATAYDTLVKWVAQMPTPVVNPPPAPVIEFTCTDATLRETALSYTLTKIQYTNTLTDLFGSSAISLANSALSTLSEDTFDPKSYNRTSILSEAKALAYFSVAKIIAGSVVSDNTKVTAIFGSCANLAVPGTTCINTYINGFARKILRRPLNTEETTFAQGIANRGGDYKNNLKTLLSLHLQSPPFIWRLELGNASQTSTLQTQLTPYEIAARISYSAADTTPDDTLIAAAANNQLTTLAQVQAQTRRILQSARGREKTRSNLMRWSLNDTAVDFSVLPAALKTGLVTAGLGQEMVNETKQFIDYSVFDQNSSFKTLLTSKVSLAANTSLAKIYGHAPVTAGTTGSFVGRRQGLLMRSSFLSYPSSRTGIIRRGVDFQKQMLCNEIPPPSSTIVDLREGNDFTSEEKLLHTNREIIAHKTSSPLCMSCHATINPTGFAFESLDPFGRIRSQESIFDSTGTLVRTLPIDSAATVPLPTGASLSVQDAYDLVTYVATSSEGSACFSRNTFRFVNERRETSADSCQLNSMHKIVFDSNRSVLDSLVELIANDALFVKKN